MNILTRVNTMQVTMNKNAILIEKFRYMKQNTCITLWWCSSSPLFSRLYEFIIIYQAKPVLFNCLFMIHYQSILTFNKSTYRQLIITCWDAPPPLPPTIQFFLNFELHAWMLNIFFSWKFLIIVAYFIPYNISIKSRVSKLSH